MDDIDRQLLGLLREDRGFARRFVHGDTGVEAVRAQIEAVTIKGEKVATSVDLPLSNECKRVLAYAAEEAERLSHKHIGSEHLALGLLREENCLAAQILKEHGVRLSALREELANAAAEGPTGLQAVTPTGLSRFAADITRAALENHLLPLVGRENEIERIVHVLGRSDKNNPVLVGEPGVGKRSIVEGLAQKIADGEVPSLAEDRILSLDLSMIIAGAKASWHAWPGGCPAARVESGKRGPAAAPDRSSG